MKKGTVSATQEKATKGKNPGFAHQPLGNRVIVLQSDADNMTEGGIIIPNISQDRPNRGTVVAAGVECKEVKAGDRVEFGEYAGTEIRLDGVGYLTMREPDIFLILK